MIVTYRNLVNDIELENNKIGLIKKKILEHFNLNVFQINYVKFIKQNNEQEICGIDNSFYSMAELENYKEIIIFELENNIDNIDLNKVKDTYNTFIVAQYENEFLDSQVNLINNILSNLNVINFEVIEEGEEELEDVKIVLKEEDFDNLEKETNTEEVNCAICLEKIEGECVKLKCGHKYHIDCCKEWLCKNSNKCPQCKTEIGNGVQL